MAQTIQRGVINSVDTSTQTCSVLLLEATSTYLTGIPLSNCFNANNAQSGDFCGVVFMDPSNYTDCCVAFVYPNGNLPANPGITNFLTGYQQFSAQSITSGSTSTFTLTGGSSGIPSGVSGVICKVEFSSPTAGAFLHLAPHGASDITAYMSLGNIQVASSFVYGGGLLQVDASGKIDIKANVGNCTVWMWTCGYIS